MRSRGFRTMLTAMSASMACVATMCIQVPLPTGGYGNLGDGLALMCGFILGPLYGSAAAGIGSALADVLTGYAQYAPGTLVIKSMVSLVAALLLRSMEKLPLPQRLRLCFAAIPGECAMVLGYLFYDWLCLGYGPGALVSLPGNLAQGAVNATVAILLVPMVMRPREVQELMEKFKR